MLCLVSKTQFQAADLRLTEVKREAHEFERDMLKAANKPSPEEVTKYLEYKLKTKVE